MLGGLDDGQALAGYQVTHFQPFDAVRKRTEATVTAADGTTFKVTKGAPQVIMALSADSGQVKAAVDTARSATSRRGVSARWAWPAPTGKAPGSSSACCRCSTRRATDAKATIATARQLGVEVKMVTGDQVAIARETAKAARHGHGHP